MESLVAIFELPGGQLVLDLVSIALCLWLVGDLRRTRAVMHERINLLNGSLTAHEIECAKRWGQVKEKLGIHE